jgi:hypothetical protein
LSGKIKIFLEEENRGFLNKNIHFCCDPVAGLMLAYCRSAAFFSERKKTPLEPPLMCLNKLKKRTLKKEKKKNNILTTECNRKLQIFI